MARQRVIRRLTPREAGSRRALLLASDNQVVPVPALDATYSISTLTSEGPGVHNGECDEHRGGLSCCQQSFGVKRTSLPLAPCGASRSGYHVC